MKLKSISIHGFKSFADRIHIQYHDGITGVIGPNGSGKSNVIDAVRWVMGEQTAKSLRAEDPTDIIFAGSQNRKKGMMAEVTLTFTNDGKRCPPEYLHLPEVSIGRRIFRDGAREYSMNGEPCRLKDIVDFLLAIGLGSKSYAIIQQEKRDRIIQAGPQEMREILEETAGISIFKTRRKEAEKRLESTRTHLVSLGDMEQDFTRQSASLREQVEKATQKAALMGELRTRETELLGHQVGMHRKEVNRLRAEISSKNKEAEKSALQAGEWESRANELQAERNELVLQSRNATDAFDEKRLQLERYRAQVEGSKRLSEERAKRRAQLAEDVAREREEIARDEQRVQDLAADIAEADKANARLDNEIEALRDRMDEADEELMVERGRGEEIRSELNATNDLMNRLRVENETWLRALEKASGSQARIDAELNEATTRRGATAADRQNIETQLSRISEGLGSVSSERSRIEGELADLDARAAEATEVRNAAKEAHVGVASHVAALTKLVGGGAGLSDGTRALRDHLSQFLQGFVFEKVTVHKEDERILESALPELLEAGLVANSETLMDLLDKAEELGVSRMGLVVREMIVPLSADEVRAKAGVLDVKGLRCVGERATRVEVEELGALLNRVFVARDEWLALKALRAANAAGAHGFVIVTERGTVFSSGGGARELTFGEKKDGEGVGLLARKRELAELETEKERLQQELARSEGALFEISSRRKTIDVRLREISDQFSREKEEVTRLSGALRGFDLELKHADETIARFEQQKQDLLRESGAAREAFAANQSKLETLEKEATRFRRAYEEFEDELSSKKDVRDEIQTQFTQKRSDKQVSLARQAGARQNYESAVQAEARARQKIDRSLAELASYEDQLQGAGEQLAALEREIRGLDSDVVRLSEVVREIQSREAEVEEELRVTERNLKESRDTKEKVSKFVSEREMGIARNEAFLDTLLRDAWEKFAVHPDSLPKESEADSKYETGLAKRIKDIGTEVAALGPVNERAVEEFREVEEKRIFLVQQREDVEKSMADLLTSIAEIEEITRARFQEIFTAVNTQFQRLFPILFPGGHAELVMLTPEDLLNTGVEIQVKLPGKNQQNMNLFSGGEKALTAISLIFSLLKTTPAPFCYLDEVDAPLDEANVGRFNAVLDALSDEFQFVVITHNRRTMEILDTCYGITMQEPGVSRIVSVDFTEQAPHLQKKPRSAIKLGASAVQ